MKNLIYIFTLYCLVFFSCSKNNNVLPNSQGTSLNVINGIIGAAPLFVKNNNAGLIFSKIASGNKITYGAYLLSSPLAGQQSYQFIQNTDTLHTLVNLNLNLATGGTYSLFLAGTVSQPDTLLTRDNLPYYPAADSVGGVRFINLSVGAAPVSVDIKGNANGSEVASLPYKGATIFKTYSATHTVSSYIFELRDAGTGTLIASYTFSGVNNATGTNTATNTFRFKNHTLALIGQPGGTGAAAQKIILVNNY